MVSILATCQVAACRGCFAKLMSSRRATQFLLIGCLVDLCRVELRTEGAAGFLGARQGQVLCWLWFIDLLLLPSGAPRAAGAKLSAACHQEIWHHRVPLSDCSVRPLLRLAQSYQHPVFHAGHATVVLSAGGRLSDWHRSVVQFGWYLCIAACHTGCCSYKYSSGWWRIMLRKGIGAVCRWYIVWDTAFVQYWRLCGS